MLIFMKLLLYGLCNVIFLPAVQGAHAVLAHTSLRSGAWGSGVLAEVRLNTSKHSRDWQPVTSADDIDPDALDYEELTDVESWRTTWGWLFFALSVNFGAFFLAVTLAHFIPPRPTSSPEFYWRMFLKPQNAQYADDLEMAVRGAFGAMLIAAPYYIPDAMFLVKQHRYTSDIAVMFVFTIYKTVGETAELAFSGMCGTFMACFNIWIMFGIFPEGVTEESGTLVWWCGFLDAILYIIFISGTHWSHSAGASANLKMFALNWHCYFIMSFMDPSPVPFSKGFTLRLTGPAVSAFLMSSIGAGMAVLCTILPFPLFALDKARSSAASLAEGVAAAWNTAANVITTVDAGPELLDEFLYDVRGLDGLVESMNGYIFSAWWECLGVGKPQIVRECLTQMGEPLKLLFDRICGVRNIVTSSSEPLDAEIVTAVKPHVAKLCDVTGRLLQSLVAAAQDGTMDDDEKVLVSNQMDEVRQAMRALCDEFHSRSSPTFAARENALMLMVSSYGNIVIECGNAMVAKMNGEAEVEKPNPRAAFQNALLGVRLWDDPLYRNEFIRNVSAVLICFVAGYYGYSAIFPGYNAYPAATVSLLLSSGLTPKIAKNMTRLQGVLFGGVLGQIAYALLAWCSVTGYVFAAVFVFCWSIGSLFMYFHSTNYGLLGCLVSAFGLGGFLKGCSNEVFTTNSSYGIVVSLVFLILVKIVIDFSFAKNYASAEATAALCGAWRAYRKSWTEFCDPAQDKIYYNAESIKQAFKAAAALGIEALEEPRGTKTDWKGDLFASVCSSGVRMCESLSNMEASFSQTGKDGGDKSVTLQELMKDERFNKVRDHLESQLAFMEDLCNQVFLNTVPGHFANGFEPKAGAKDMATDTVMKDLKALADGVVKASREAMSKAGTSSESNLEMSSRCKIGVVLFTIKRQLDYLCGLERTILSTA